MNKPERETLCEKLYMWLYKMYYNVPILRAGLCRNGKLWDRSLCPQELKGPNGDWEGVLALGFFALFWAKQK